MNYSGWTVVLGVSLAIASGSWADWSQFRGPGGNAVTEDAAPQTWSAEENLVWRAELPGLGTSSPIVVGDQVLVTCYSGYGQSAEMPGKQENLVRHVISVNRQDGRQQWQVTVPADTPESVYGGGNNGWHGYSSSTPVSDGTHVYVFFGRSGVFAFDLQGQQRWRSTVGTGVTGWGSGASPVLFGDLLIVNASVESRSLVALDKKDGQVKWRVEGIKGCWN
ncbi:MAG: PQQ-binding-like beta-propeller repeat protein, partial [Pirellulaceae bacterium]